MPAQTCLVNTDVARVRQLMKKSPPVDINKQKMAEKQSRMFVDLKNDSDFQKSIAGLKTKDKIGAYQKKISDNDVPITRKLAHQLMKDYDKGILRPSLKPIVKSKPVTPTEPIVKPKLPPVVKPKIEPIVVPPVSKYEQVPFKEAETVEEALKEWKKYGKNKPDFGNWSDEKKLEVMNSINGEAHSMERWARGRKIKNLEFPDGDREYAGLAQENLYMKDNTISVNRRNTFMRVGFAESSRGSLDDDRFSVCKTMGGPIFRHEMGHVMWYDTMNKKVEPTNDFTLKFDSINKQVIKKNVSRYAATDAEEFFAESFAIYSSPKYKAGTLNKVFGSGFEELMEDILVSGAGKKKIIPKIEKKIEKIKPRSGKKVSFSSKTNQKNYDDFYNKFLNDKSLQTKEQFAEEMVKISPANYNEAFGRWKFDTNTKSPIALKMKAERLELTKLKTRIPEEFLTKERLSFFASAEKKMSDKEYLRIRALNQAYMKKQGFDKITLYRGTDGKSGKKIAKDIKEIKEKNIVVSENSLVGYSSERSIADRFGKGAGGVTTKIDFDSKDVVLHFDLWPETEKGGEKYKKEKEFIVLGGIRTIPAEDVFY